MYYVPNADETFETHLRDVLEKEVAVCCSDDPWLWAREDIRIQVFPALQEGIANVRERVPSTRDMVLQNMRKCWYIVSRFETDEAWKWPSWKEDIVDFSEAVIKDMNEEFARVKRYEAKTAVGRISNLLDEFSPDVWRGEVPVPEIAVIITGTLIPEFKRLHSEADRAFYIKRNTSDVFWETLIGDFRKHARKIQAWKSILFHQA